MRPPALGEGRGYFLGGYRWTFPSATTAIYLPPSKNRMTFFPFLAIFTQ